MGLLRNVFVAGVVGAGSLAAWTRYEKRPVYGRSLLTDERRPWDKNWDQMEPQSTAGQGETPPAKPTATRHLILVRHGQYEMNHSESDKKILTELGRQQALATGERLKTLGRPYTHIIHSPVIRAVQTAQLISKSLPDVPMKSTDLLAEGAPIEPEPPVSYWQPAQWEFFQEGARIEAAFRSLFHRALPDQKENSVEIIVCHGNVIRYCVCRALQLPPEAWLRINIGHCGLTCVSIRPNGRVSLRSLGDTGHLPPHLLTFS